MLKTERNTKTMENRIKSAAAQKFGRGKARLFFEHGQWWAVIDDPIEDRDITYSVVDAEGPGTIDGFDFEEIG